jgi:imidazole glycerol-phosphate synthase subunit HisF
MLRKRIIPCLDVSGGRVVKGVNFVNLRDCGEPVEAALRYAEQGADEIVWLNITATGEDPSALCRAVERAAEQIDIPLTVGGGVNRVGRVRELLLAGADKVSLNTSALARPSLISEAADRFGSQCVVCAIDARRQPDGGWRAYVDGGRKPTDWDAVAWAALAVELGAGEILMTSMDSDGVQDGYDLELVETLCATVNVPVVASGGAGNPEHLADALEAGAEAALAASIFHDGTHTVEETKAACRVRGLPMR